jgi:hypothetical protein
LILTLEVGHLREVERWALSWGPDCEVLEPAELRVSVADALERAASHYRRGPEADGGPRPSPTMKPVTIVEVTRCQ